MAAWTASKPAYPTVESRFYFDVAQKSEIGAQIYFCPRTTNL